MGFGASKGLVYLLGGQDANGSADDIWSYDPSADVWAEVDTPEGSYVGARVGGVLVDVAGELFLMHGEDPGEQ